MNKQEEQALVKTNRDLLEEIDEALKHVEDLAMQLKVGRRSKKTFMTRIDKLWAKIQIETEYL